MDNSQVLITTIVGAIVLASVLGLLASRIKVSPLVGYLAAGIVFGPATPGFVADGEIVSRLAEIGVILLMFAVGLGFSLKDLLSVKTIAIPGSISQIIVTTLLGLGFGLFIGWPFITALVFGLCLSIASTVVLLRSLEERNLIETPKGRIAVGWLIVEDLTMVFVLVILPAVVSGMSGDDFSLTSLLLKVAKTIGSVVAFIFIMLIGGRRIIPWFLAKSASTGSNELFTLAVLGIALGIALTAVQLFGASIALGAFFAGMALSESELSHRAATNILPLKEAFAVLFFVSVGMLFDPYIFIEHPIATIFTVLIILVGKPIIAYFIVRLYGNTKRTALVMSASLSQIGEFSYILAALGLSLNIFPPEACSLILAGSIISIIVNPLIFSAVDQYLAKTETIVDKMIDPVSMENQLIPDDLTNHAIIIGYSKLGRIMAEQFAQEGIAFVVIDTSLSFVEKLRKEGIMAIVGNASHIETLKLANLNKAKWLIISTPNGYESGEITALARKMNTELVIYVRAFYADEVEYISNSGATQVITGEKEIAAYILGQMNISTSDIIHKKEDKIPTPNEEISETFDYLDNDGSPIEDNKEKSNDNLL